MKKILFLLGLLICISLVTAEEPVDNLDDYEIRITEIKNGDYDNMQLVEFVYSLTGETVKTIDTFQSNPYNFLPFAKEDDPYFEKDEIDNLVRYKDVKLLDYIALSNDEFLTQEFLDEVKEYHIHTLYSIQGANLLRDKLVSIVYVINIALDESMEGLGIITSQIYNCKGDIILEQKNVMGTGGVYLIPNRRYLGQQLSGKKYYSEDMNKTIKVFNNSGSRIYDLETGLIIFEDERVTGMETIFNNPNNEIRFTFRDTTRMVCRHGLGIRMWINPEKGTITYHEKNSDTGELRMNVKTERIK